MEKYVWTIGGHVNSELTLVSHLSTSMIRTLNKLGIFLYTEVGLVRTTRTTYEYTFYADLLETKVTPMLEKLTEVFDYVEWKMLSAEESQEWNK